MNRLQFGIYLFRKLLFFVFCSILLSACAVVGINIGHKTPHRPFKYPYFTEADSLHGNINKYRSCFDVTYYNLSVAFELEHKSLIGDVKMNAMILENFDTIQLDLYSNLVIDSIIQDSRTLAFYRKYNSVFIIFNQTQKKNDKFLVTVYYHGKPVEAKRPPWEGGFVWKLDDEKNPWIGVACEVNGASLWWPCKDHLSDEPDSMEMHYTVPMGLNCISNGVMTDSVSDGKKITYSWKVSYPINTYNATFYIGKFAHFAIPYMSDSSDFTMDFYVLQKNLNIAKIHLQQAYEIVKQYESFFGRYPWPKDGYKLIESPFEGMEHQSAIAYGAKYRNTAYVGCDYIILHETAHEWWGNSVSVPDYAEIWIHEGFATYSEALYVEATQGYDAYVNFLRYYALLIKNKRPIIGPHNVNYWDYKDIDVYMKGALTLHTLRNSINNDSIFRDILKTFYYRYALKMAVTKNFIDIVNEKTGKDYTAFFNQYLYSRTCPEMLWDYSYDIKLGKSYIYYKWTNANEGFSIPIRVKSGERIFLIRPTNKLQKMELPYSKSIVVNSNESYIASTRTEKF
jgi:aminopeptidase N